MTEKLLEPPVSARIKCRICQSKLDPREEGDDVVKRVCGSCGGRPEAKKLGDVAAAAPGALEPARAFTVSERSLIRKTCKLMSYDSLLTLLNDRLRDDLGPDANPYTMAQLTAEIGDSGARVANGARDWTSLRQLLAAARKSGLLARITEQMIDDFAIVFRLTPKQVMELKDIVLLADRG